MAACCHLSTGCGPLWTGARSARPAARFPGSTCSESRDYSEFRPRPWCIGAEDRRVVGPAPGESDEFVGHQAGHFGVTGPRPAVARRRCAPVSADEFGVAGLQLGASVGPGVAGKGGVQQCRGGTIAHATVVETVQLL